jgi:hypothetical protein
LHHGGNGLFHLFHVTGSGLGHGIFELLGLGLLQKLIELLTGFALGDLFHILGREIGLLLHKLASCPNEIALTVIIYARGRKIVPTPVEISVRV